MNKPTAKWLVTFLLLTIGGASVGYAEVSASRQGERLQELFIWKMSEELKLEPHREQKFAEAIRRLSEGKKKAAEKLEKAVQDLGRAKSKKEADKALKRYQTALNEFQAIPQTELNQLRSLLGSEKLAKYIVAKSEMAEKLKSLLSSPTESPNSTKN